MKHEWIVPRTCTRCGHTQEIRIPAFAVPAALTPDETLRCLECHSELLVWGVKD
jgi:hypothetical protein